MTPALVASGSLRVDQGRALLVLRRYQLEDPRDFLLPWLRLAAASKAADARLRTRPGGLDLRFDGEPLAGARLADPFECLFGCEDPDERARYGDLAAGLLGALHLSPRRLTLRSGGPGHGVRLTIDGCERQSLAEDPETPAGTSIEVSWRGWFTRGRTRECLRRAWLARGALSVPLIIDGWK